jgi:hypothetical protein
VPADLILGAPFATIARAFALLLVGVTPATARGQAVGQPIGQAIRQDVGAADSQTVVMVVNATNPVTALQLEQVTGAFLGKTYRWPNGGQEVLAVDQVDRSPARALFVRQILGKTVDAVKAYWQRQIFTGRTSPPPQRVSDADVLIYVRSNPGALGYVQAGTDLGTGVRIIAVVP